MDIIKKTIKDAERLLKAVRANYYIELPTGEEISCGLDGYEIVPVQEEEKPKAKKRTFRSGLPFGSVAAHYRPYLEKCANVGDIAEIPVGEFNADHLRAAVCAYCTHFWGKGTYTSVLNKVKNQIEVLRTAPNTVESATTRNQAKAANDERKAGGESKVNGGRGKFHTVGHGMDALSNLRFDDDHPQP